MSKDDSFLPVKMEKLDLEPENKAGSKTRSNASDENPFFRRHSMSNKAKPILSRHCLCLGVKRHSKTFINSKKYQSKILKDPVLKYIHKCCDDRASNKEVTFVKTLPVLQVNQMEQFNNNDLSADFNSLSFKEVQRRNACDVVASNITQNNLNPGPSCSQQALNPPCDITMDELASYFETMVHIPKKMSSMAEMMYI